MKGARFAMNYENESLKMHYELKGKLEMVPRAAVVSTGRSGM